MATVVATDDLLEDAALIVDVCIVRRGGRRRHDHLRRRPRRRGRAPSPRSCVERGGWPVDHEQRDAGAPRPRRRALPDGAAGEPAPRDGRLGRGDHHRQPRVGEPLRPRQRGARDVRGEREDRLGRARHGRVGPHARGPRARRAADEGRDGGARGQEAVPRDDAARHRLHGLDRGPAAARADAEQGARPDDEPDPAVGRGRVRGRSRTSRTAPPSSTASCSASA